ncbi:uncharacterized protein LOC123544387 [Mercenaria mercenaria]|uniref:uncharacterized protein LOC123544387 n=1 Tax=Mercenaria mercenaria TaxID=6596 RepID=UPI00234F9A1D|nr:uncharacterized protein LOC123544387 [Mercenaria mercenaria]XP_053382404.1 uncharacterized protein LOC123544387 [Mercenaria mercenaria]XP_053382405.1 uncharacterized protein LOC123544387 [Mercenaria mercenaria]
MTKLRKVVTCVGVSSLLIVVFMCYQSSYYLFIENTATLHKKKLITPIHIFKREFQDVNITNSAASLACTACVSYINNTKNKTYEYFSGKYSLDKPPMTSWIKPENTQSFCDNRVIIYSDLFGIIHNVTLFPTRRNKISSQAKGGEEIKEVLNQGEDKENYQFNSDFLEMECKNDVDVGSHSLKTMWLKSLKLVPAKQSESKNLSLKYIEKYVIAVRRQDYANLHNWVRNIYNTFLMMMHFRIQPKDVSVLFMDGHPWTELDKAWEVLYNKPVRVGRMQQSVNYQNFILGFQENHGPITEFHNQQVSYIEEFRSFVFSQFNLDPSDKLDCSKPRITLIIRRNAVYHPRNVVGNVGRKIFNEAELINDLMKAFPNACVKPSLMEALPMRSQLDVIKRTDILIGMHGAGMSHVTFLPKHAGVLELFAKGFKNGRPWFECFNSIAKWRNLQYDSWENFDSALEMPADFTILPTDVIVDKTRGLMNKLCKKQ